MSLKQPLSLGAAGSADGPLAVVLQAHQEIAAVIKHSTSQFPAARRRQLLALSQWFEQPVTPERVLGRPDALSICLPLLQSSDSDDGLPSRWQIEDAVHQAFAVIYSPRTQCHSLLSIMVYPLVLLALSLLLMYAFSVFLIPEFESMFLEFGLTIPANTSFVIAMSHVIRACGSSLWTPIVLVIGTWLASVGWKRWHKTERMPSPKREAAAAWAWHVGLLLKLGVAQADAIDNAGAVCRQHNLRKQSADWSKKLRTGYQPFEAPESINARPRSLIAVALSLPHPTDQSEMLFEVAAIYRDRDQVQTRWWWGLLTPAMICFIGLMIAFVVIALFMPLAELITGLV